MYHTKKIELFFFNVMKRAYTKGMQFSETKTKLTHTNGLRVFFLTSIKCSNSRKKRSL